MSEHHTSPAHDPHAVSHGSSMTSYRAYKIGWEGRIIAVVHLDGCIDDAAALEAAKQLGWGYVVEVWDRGRFVDRLPCDKSG
uniref:Uncharacterized protein n=1 Tax=Rhodopseudomonas palustris (strain BisA53) TaxID=316055 RepID=Q07R57_RHOP5